MTNCFGPRGEPSLSTSSTSRPQMRDACSAGRNAFLAGRIERKLYANASSPLEGVIGARG